MAAKSSDRHVSIAMIAAHVGASPAAVRRALKVYGLKVEKFPGVRGGRVKFADAERVVALHWPHIGSLALSELCAIPVDRFLALERTVTDYDAILRQVEKSDTGHASSVLRLKAQLLAVQSIVTETLQRVGLSREEVDGHFVVRERFYLDQFLDQCEKEMLHIAAMLDDRTAGEVPTERGFPPLFPREKE